MALGLRYVPMDSRRSKHREAMKLARKLGIPAEEVYRRRRDGQHYCGKHGWHRGTEQTHTCPDCARLAAARHYAKSKEGR